ncbi:S-DNA-T family DNA segregation ATPase FtsK/SpoIIIE [Streptococcus gallinaceus]|uniref:DNA translocase FtsK n=1 Tax=Streptococcus gallinaceus TaxID=165758 RepID=UPI00209D410D|nr:DNA translocase FtsK [Streptococcus gallinaceus]MCP1638332.1 S-DNA-T family DNA segregation ATPase FtsK/SpoIIIE [Streptococcus gallinaceus]MCP1769581.1 S-DNA-T family DNA segregation ATPase FtsK/SpoIIIE [Streptococcus gallinaceus]
MKKNTKKGKTTRRPTKAEQAQRQNMRALLLRIAGLILLGFAAVKMGAFGLTAYNILRAIAGSSAYLLLVGIAVYLLFSQRIHRREGVLSGFLLFLAGILLEFQAYLDVTYKGEDLFAHTVQLLLEDTTKFQVTHYLGGGLVGGLLYMPVSFLFATIGSFFIGILLITFGLFFMSPWSVYDLADMFALAVEKYQEKSAIRAEKRQERRWAKEAEKEARLAEEEARREQEALAEAERQSLLEEEPLLAYPSVDMETGEILEDIPHEPIIRDYQDLHLPDFPTEEMPVSLEEEFPVLLADEEPFEAVPEEGDEEIVFAKTAPTLKDRLAYRLPSIDLFAPAKASSQVNEKKLVRQNIKVLEDTFASFGIKVVVERAEIGPSVTRYEVKPAVGVRVNRISNLADDLALALAAKDVRIEAPIPGKSLVGIEVPNSEVASVSFRELWEQAQTNPRKLLEVPLGKAVNGSAKSFDLTKMPHLLVAGSTGSGKSVAVNGIISSILMKARPDEVKFMMIDPKMVELSVYNDIPHLLIPVVTNPRKASRALQKVVDEMENRYELFSKVGVRNIEGYNAKVEEFNAQSQEKQIPLPLIVVIVDELADLMMVASKEVEDAIIRLGQKARAAGIHMILATQRPSVDVISGLIKANVPSRVAFAVASGTDSRTILGENGAEKLLGRGDMLFHPIGESAPLRLQGSFISDGDVERIVTFIKDQADAEYDESFDPGEVSESDDFSGNGGSATLDGDPLFAEARALVIETQKASASMIQRRLSVGFNRATRLMEELEEAGVIGPAEGTKPRKVLETQ